MLREAGVRVVVDVRSFPKSKRNPDFNDDVFADRLAEHQIAYRHVLALGGRSTPCSSSVTAARVKWEDAGWVLLRINSNDICFSFVEGPRARPRDHQ
ncbi:DUF488 domain-containing protein [Pseudosulfitobacter koreensis]|uniref:DUF488 domain-containing protein n=1 Tax=Pseudosulfitobacter koreensis TaxID=2968472 RepID=A0ABT1Z4I0_9RHOB|nr:DUF488 domain-containing protein [Pseudosulfitobacter koreense]MCR8828042.1 DUF488 domain-containing protein [Pseudosulfitobacter koreense]